MEYLGNSYNEENKQNGKNKQNYLLIGIESGKEELFKPELACWIDGCGAKVCGIKFW